MLGLLCRRRNLVGNISLVIFLTFLATITFGTVTPGIASADNGVVQDNDSSAIYDAGKTTVTIDITINPVTGVDFDNLTLKMLLGDSSGASIAEKVYKAAYSDSEGVYKVVYGFVYDGLYTGNQIYLAVYDTVYDSVNPLGSITLNVRAKPGEGGSSGGGGASTPKPKAVETDQGTVEVTQTESTLAVNTQAALDMVQEAVASGANAVTFAIPGDQVRENNTIAVPAEVLATALAGDNPVAVQVQVAGTTLAISPGAIDMSVFKDQDVSFEFVINRKSADSAVESGGDLADVARYRVAGDVYEFSIRVKDKDGKDLGSISYFADGSATLTLPYDGDFASEQGIDENSLRIFRQNSAGGWDKVGGTVDASNNTITVARDSLSKYTVMTNTFSDIFGHWAQENVELMAAKGIAKGMTDDAFAPNAGITRAQFAALLVRSLDLNQSANYKGLYTDIAGNSWYYSEVEAAAATGIVNGYEDGTFKPDADITREQMAAMIVRAMATAGQEVAFTEAEADALLAGFSDAASIADWAKESVAVAVDTSIVNGRTADTIVPGEGATRAESATMIQRLLVYLDRI